MGILALSIAGCEARTVSSPDDGIDFGEVGGEGDGDGDSTASDEGETGGSLDCMPVVENLIIDDNTELDSVRCVEEVLGNLTVQLTGSLEQLDALSELRSVGGTLYVNGNIALTSLEGLEGLESVDWLHIRRNHELTDLHGLSGLQSVRRITVSNNIGLTSLWGLPGGLAPVMLEVGANESLEDLDGLPLFEPPGGGSLTVEIEDNPLLADLGGLSSCCSGQAISLLVEGNEALFDLTGLEYFVRLDALRLFDNQNLVDFGGLDNLTEVRLLALDYTRCIEGNEASFIDFSGADKLGAVEILRVEWVGSLASFAGLEGLASLDKLQVRYNEALSWQAVLDFADQTSPTVADLCGGVGGPECPADPCPMF